MGKNGCNGRVFRLEQALRPLMNAVNPRMRTELQTYLSVLSHGRSLLHDFISLRL
jgi:hypothetical protein